MKKPGKYQYLFLIFIFGAAIMFGNYFSTRRTRSTAASQVERKNNDSVEVLGKQTGACEMIKI